MTDTVVPDEQVVFIYRWSDFYDYKHKSAESNENQPGN